MAGARESPLQAAHVLSPSTVANFDPGTFSLMRCDFCGAGFDTRAGLSSHARAHLRDFGITNWELTVSPINILQELLATSAAERPPSPLGCEPGGSPSGFLTSRRPRLPLAVPFPPTWAEDPGPAYGDGKGRGCRGGWGPDPPQGSREMGVGVGGGQPLCFPGRVSSHFSKYVDNCPHNCPAM